MKLHTQNQVTIQLEQQMKWYSKRDFSEINKQCISNQNELLFLTLNIFLNTS